MSDLGWWALPGEQLMEMMRRAHAGEDPELLYAEFYANADAHEWPEPPSIGGLGA